ncbi:hypothetical protein ACFZAG_35595 [Streptomyces sp. NPDC012403]|uniref:hypothetical protein n=1 Tax=Streptomyces sp. NPDC012403 TaxID=3364831 RepID=UPI0036E09478
MGDFVRRVRRLWLLRFLSAPEGRWTVVGAAGAAIALGLAPDLVQLIPWVDGNFPGMLAWAVLGLVVVSVAQHKLRGKDGVGIVLYLGGSERWHHSRVQAMVDHARSRHDTCFVVEPSYLLQETAGIDPVTIAHRVVQARLEEAAGTAAEVPRNVSFYVNAPHSHAYELGKILWNQPAERVRVFTERGDDSPPLILRGSLMGMSEERGQVAFEMLRLDSRLKDAPAPEEIRLLRDQVLSAESDPPQPELLRDTPDAAEAEGRRKRLALIVSFENNSIVPTARRAAESGRSDGYQLPRVPPGESATCAMARVIRTRAGNVPDNLHCHEALVRHVFTTWRRDVHEHDITDTWLFTDGPTGFVLAMGALLGANATLVPWRPRPRVPGQVPGRGHDPSLQE